MDSSNHIKGKVANIGGSSFLDWLEARCCVCPYLCLYELVSNVELCEVFKLPHNLLELKV